MSSEWKLPWEGGCRCGALRYRISEPPVLGTACHCTGCQRMTSSAFSIALTLPGTGFEIIAGEPVLGGLKKPEIRHHHCPSCLSWVFTRADVHELAHHVRATTLDDPSWFVPLLEVWTSEKLPWAVTGAKHSHSTQPDPGGFWAMITEYQESGARP